MNVNALNLHDEHHVLDSNETLIFDRCRLDFFIVKIEDSLRKGKGLLT